MDCLVGISTLKTPKNEEKQHLFLHQLSYQVDKKKLKIFISHMYRNNNKNLAEIVPGRNISNCFHLSSLVLFVPK